MDKAKLAELIGITRRRLKDGANPGEATDWLAERMDAVFNDEARRERILTLCIQHGQGREPAQLVQDAAMFLAWIDGEAAPSVQLGPTKETTHG